MEPVAAGDDVALELLLRALVDVPHARALALEVVERDVRDLEVERAAALEARGDEVLDDLGLPVDDDRLADQLVEGDAVALAARLQLDACVDEPLAAHPLADAGLLVELGDVVLEDTRPDPRLDVVAASVLEDDRVDPGDVEQLGQRQARRACSDDRDLRLRHGAPRSNRAAWPWPTPTHIVASPYRPLAATELVEQRHDEPRTAHPERVADRDRAAVDVHALLVDPEVAHHGERLRGERLVQLDEVDVLDRDAGAVEQLADGRDRADAHHGGIDARDGRADEGPERLDAEIPARAPRSRSRARRRRR